MNSIYEIELANWRPLVFRCRSFTKLEGGRGLGWRIERQALLPMSDGSYETPLQFVTCAVPTENGELLTIILFQMFLEFACTYLGIVLWPRSAGK